jgi:hypothetical protein
LTDFAGTHKVPASQLKNYDAHKLWVKVDSVREMYQNTIGAHSDQSELLMRGDPFLPAPAHVGNRLSKLGSPDAEIFVDELEESEKLTESLQEDQGPDLAQADVTELKEVMQEAVGEL